MDNKANLSKIFGFVAMGVAIVSVPMFFLPVMSAFGLTANLVGLFDVGETVAAILSIVSMACAIAGAVLAIFPKKVFKLVSTITIGVSLIIDIVLIILVFANGEGILKPGVGLWLATVFSAVAFAFSLMAMLFAPKGAPVAGGYVDDGWNNGYNNGYGNMGGYGGGPDDTVFLSSGSITFLSGNNAGYQIRINDGEQIAIGKDPAMCSIVIDKKYTKVSRKHCTVRFDASQNIYVVTDCSTNGTKIVGGPRLASNTPSYVQRGTTINLANSENSFRLD